jgi:hypothetical protein
MDQELLKSNLNGLERKLLVLLNEHKTLKEEVAGLKVENQELKSNLTLPSPLSPWQGRQYCW